MSDGPRRELDGAAPSPETTVAEDATAVLRELRTGVRATVDEWLSERSGTIGLAVVQVVEDALARLQAANAARLREVCEQYERRLAQAERERSEALRSAMRRRRARVRASDRELRDKIVQLERALTEASLEAVERLRDVERRETERRLELERTYQQLLRDRDEEMSRLRRGATHADALHDTLHDQLRSRRGEH